MNRLGGRFFVVICTLYLVLCTFGLVNAAILIDDDFDRNYNVGDSVSIDFSLKDEGIVSGFVESYLKCDSDSVLVDKRWVFLNNEKKDFELEFPLGETGDCQFRIEYLNDEAVSDEFEISDEILISYVLNDKYFFPGEEVLVYGSLKKFNGENFEGVVDFNIEGMTEKSFDVDSGDFNFSYEVKDSFIPGEYKVLLSVEEKDSSGDILNSGKVESSIFVKPKASSVYVESPESIRPQLNVSFVPKLLDQVGDLMENETLVVRILDSEGVLVSQFEVVSGEEFYFDFPSDFHRGSASVGIEYGSLTFSRPIYIEDNKEIVSSVYGNTLKFTNVGNVFYDGTVKFELEGEGLNEEVFVNLSLDIGEVYLHQLEYSGVYNISSVGSKFSSVYLTGAAILVGDSGVNYRGVIVTLVFVGLLIFGYVKSRKKTKDDRKILKDRKRERKKQKKEYRKRKKVKGEGLPVKDFVDLSTGNKVKDVKVRDEKMVVLEEKEEVVDARKRVFMLFLKSEEDVSEYESIVRNFGFSLNKVDTKLGYVIFYQSNEISPEYKVYNLAKALKRFGDSRSDRLSIVLNKGVFEKKLSILKKFALFNREILSMFPGKMVVSDKIMSRISVVGERVEKEISVMNRRIRVWIL